MKGVCTVSVEIIMPDSFKEIMWLTEGSSGELCVFAMAKKWQQCLDGGAHC